MATGLVFIPEKEPLRNDGRKLTFLYFDVETSGGNPATLISYDGKFWAMTGWNSNTLEVTYAEAPE